MNKKLLRTCSIIGVISILLIILYFLYRLEERSLRDVKYRSSDYIENNFDLDFTFREVSIIKLISEPDTYEGKLVKVKGVGKIDYEGNAVYLSRFDYDHFIKKNSIYLKFQKSVKREALIDLKKLNGRVVIVEGYFTNNTGFMGLHAGTIENVLIYELASFY